MKDEKNEGILKCKYIIFGLEQLLKVSFSEYIRIVNSDFNLVFKKITRRSNFLD